MIVVPRDPKKEKTMSTLSLWRHPWTGEERIYVDGVSEQGMWFESCATSTDRDWAFCSELPCADGRTRHRNHKDLDGAISNRLAMRICVDGDCQQRLCNPHR